MSVIEYQAWPFYSFRTSTTYRAQWWQSCYVSLPVVDDFIGASGSVILFGGPGSGKSVVMAALKRQMHEQMMVIPYQIEQWPSGNDPMVVGGNHVAQIVAAVANGFWHRFQDRPEDYLLFNEIEKEYIIWLFNKYLGRRPLFRFANRLEKADVANIAVPNRDDIEDIYKSDEKSSDVRGNIGELVDVAQTLGFQAIIVLIELNEWDTVQAASDLETLFSQDLLENKGFEIKAALPESLLTSQTGVMQKAGGRFHLTPLSYAESEIDEMTERHLKAATNGKITSVRDLAETAVLQRGQEEIIKIYGRLVPGGWLNWTETLLATYVQENREIPFTQDDETSLLISFYKQHIRLKADQVRQGIWRGPQFLAIDKQPFELLCRLIELDGEASPNELKRLAGNSKTNLNTIAARIRTIVEPLAEEKIYIYLQNRRDIGYWLENGRGR